MKICIVLNGEIKDFNKTKEIIENVPEEANNSSSCC